MEAISKEFRVALPWELLYADDLVVIAESEDDLFKRLNDWKDNMQIRGMRVNINKTKVMITSRTSEANVEGCKVAIKIQKAARWPCSVCGRGVGSNSIQCISC